MAMAIERLDIPDLVLLTPARHGDARGFFSETFRADVMTPYTAESHFVQDNHVRSMQQGVVRGLHYQIPPSAQGKLVRCTRGAILDVAVDIRLGSPTYGRHVAVELSAANWQQLWVPVGFAHGYRTLEDDCEVIYKVTDYYAPECDRGIAWDDPALGIDWRLSAAEAVLSDKDRKQPCLADMPPTFRYGHRG
jgi:dTDP-4-dehydrorhamnose 3,5-epimerase